MILEPLRDFPLVGFRELFDGFFDFDQGNHVAKIQAVWGFVTAVVASGQAARAWWGDCVARAWFLVLGSS